MTKIRLTQLGCLTLLLAWYLSSALPASATPDPPPGYYASPAAPLTAGPPAQPAVVHDHIAVWTYVLIVGLTVVGTLVVVALAASLRRVSVRRADSQPEPDVGRPIRTREIDVRSDGGISADDVTEGTGLCLVEASSAEDHAQKGF